MSNAEAESYTADVTEALDTAWTRIEEARTLVAFAMDLIQNTELRDRMGSVVKQIRGAQFAYMRLVSAWDSVPEMNAAKKRAGAKLQLDTEASGPIEKEIANEEQG